MMKRLLFIIIAALCLSLTACSPENDTDTSDTQASSTSDTSDISDTSDTQTSDTNDKDYGWTKDYI